MNIGDVFIYGSHGICEVTGLQDMSMDEKIQQYYVLKPVYHATAIVYVSSISSRRKTKIRHILSADEIFSILKNIPDKCCNWNEDNRNRKELYSHIIADGNRSELIKMIKALRWHKQEIQNANKNNKLQLSDEAFLKDAETTLCEEFAYVLNIKCEEVMPFIYDQRL